MSKLRVGILFGGKSAEHEVSLQSAKNVVDALDKNKFDVVLIGIDKQGQWHVNNSSDYLLNAENPKLIKLNQSSRNIGIIPGNRTDQVIVANEGKVLDQLDVVFPILHGPLGEDGAVQGMLRLANLPFVGSSVLGSAVCMDKDVTKRLLIQADIPVCDYLVIKKSDNGSNHFQKAKQALGVPLFVKPANMGSSVGVSKVENEDEFNKALDKAFKYDNKVLIEEAINGRELEVAILGNDRPMASGVGEILPQKDFYSYEAKYIDETGALLEIPAKIEDKMKTQIQEIAIKAFQALECYGLARCDFFLGHDGKLYINEINTIPGFTNISMYPKLWEKSGISYSELIEKLLDLAIEKHRNEDHFVTDFD